MSKKNLRQQSHDVFVTQMLGKKNIMMDFLQTIVPKLAQKLTCDSFHAYTTVGTNKYLKVRIADILYTTHLKSGQNIKIAIMIEHKSNTEKKIHPQMLRYCLYFWENQEKQGQELIPIISIILYHGKKNWKIEKKIIIFHKK